VWDEYRKYHPRCKPVAPKGVLRLLLAALDAFSTEEVVSVVEWAHCSDDSQAQFLRDGGYLGLDNILRQAKLPRRVELALVWSDREYLLGEEGDVVVSPHLLRGLLGGFNDAWEIREQWTDEERAEYIDRVETKEEERNAVLVDISDRRRNQ
jgi:hypothetical protein